GEVTELMHQIADFIHNRPSIALQQQFAETPERRLEFDSGPKSARIVLPLREGYLAHLEQWKDELPALMLNRMALRLLDGPQALEAVVRPGQLGPRPLVSDEVGRQIVRTIGRSGPTEPLEQIKAVPPLVSLLCERLNTTRLQRRRTEIDTAL